jgi:hypothetical protein
MLRRRSWTFRLAIASAFAILGILFAARAAEALGCGGLAKAMFSSKHHALYWAKRYYRAGCG